MSDARRQSALLLHGLTGADRDWILARLADTDREQLSRHLTELSDLGVPGDGELIDAALSSVHPKRNRAEQSPWQQLRGANAEAMHALLINEPAWLVGTILGIENWPWSEPFTAGLDASRRERIRQARRQEVPEHLANACVSRLAARLHTVKVATPSPSDSSLPLVRLRQQFTRMVRRWL